MGFDLHVRNLKWAFSNFEHRIFLQTFTEYGLEAGGNVLIKAYQGDPKRYFPFHENIRIDWGDIIVLVQQDNLFPHKVDLTVETCNRGPIVTWDQQDYFSIYNRENKKIYPRIAEISTFMRREIVEEMKYFELCYGLNGRQFRPDGKLYKYFLPILENYKINSKVSLDPPDCFQLLSDFCQQNYKDTMFDVSMYSFCTGKPVCLLRPAAMVHMSNPEIFHREYPDYYSSAERLLHLDVPKRPSLRRNIPNVALMCLLSGVYERDSFVAEALKRGDSVFRFGLSELYKNAAQWMSIEQLDRMHWATDQVFSTAGQRQQDPVQNCASS